VVRHSHPGQVHWNHFVSQGDLCGAARARLREIGQDDVDEIVSLGLSSAERVWGIQEDDVLKLLWWDPNHQIRPSMRK